MLPIKLMLFISLVTITQCSKINYCSADYCNNNKQHTLCKYQSEDPASICLSYERTILSDTDRRLILDKINSRRNKVAAGEIRSLPSAAGMMKLEWNTELEKSAQRWADQCVKHGDGNIHDVCRDLVNMPVGQNVATVQGDSPGLTPVALVDVWYMELLKINSSVISRYVPSTDNDAAHYDFFTQLVWQDSTAVGCGGVKFQERLDVKYRTIYRLICNFAPAGNRRNKTVYSCGLPCSACSDGVCDKDYHALCEQQVVPDYDYSKKGFYDDNKSDARNVDETNPQNTTTMLTGDSIFDSPIFSNRNMELGNESLLLPYFPHLRDSLIMKDSITIYTQPVTKDDALLDHFIELLKKKLSNDPSIKNFLVTALPESTILADYSFSDENVAAFINLIYSKKEVPTTIKTTPKDYVNSTLLVDLIEAVIFRSNDKVPSSEVYRPETQTLPVIRPIKVQAELAEVKQNKEFTGHYFFPEDDDENKNENTEYYYDNTNIAQPNVEMEIEHLKISSMTTDFLDDIFESDTSTEKMLDIPSGHGNYMKNKFAYQPKRRIQRYKRSEKEEFRNLDCTHKSTTMTKICSCAFYDINNKKYVSYKVLLQKIAADLKKLNLNDLFHCARNKSIVIIFHSFLLIYGWVFMY